MIIFFESISPDAWIQSIGTLLGAGIGAFLGGLIALKASNDIYKKQKRDNDLVRINNIQLLVNHNMNQLSDAISNLIDISMEYLTNPVEDACNRMNKSKILFQYLFEEAIRLNEKNIVDPMIYKEYQSCIKIVDEINKIIVDRKITSNPTTLSLLMEKRNDFKERFEKFTQSVENILSNLEK